MRTQLTHQRSKRLVLRPLAKQDAPQIAVLAGDWDVARMTARIPYPYQETDAVEWINALPENEHVFVIEQNATFVGLCGVTICEHDSAEIGYWIGKPWWGVGYATEAAAALVRYCFKELKLQRLTCCHYIDNSASARVIEKLGFEPTGECSAWCQARRKDVPAITYELKRPRFAFLWRPAA